MEPLLGAWLRGGFPRSFLAATVADSAEWRRAFVRTFLERDIPELGVRVRAIGVSASTVGRYLDLLTDALVLRQLPPWHENLSKRQGGDITALAFGRLVDNLDPLDG